MTYSDPTGQQSQQETQDDDAQSMSQQSSKPELTQPGQQAADDTNLASLSLNLDVLSGCKCYNQDPSSTEVANGAEGVPSRRGKHKPMPR